jgi:hypothetical protein
MRLSGPLIVAMVFRIYAEFPIDVDVPTVTEHLRQAAIAAGCASPRMQMYWRGRGDASVEVLLWCPEKEAPHGQETPGSDRSPQR